MAEAKKNAKKPTKSEEPKHKISDVENFISQLQANFVIKMNEGKSEKQETKLPLDSGEETSSIVQELSENTHFSKAECVSLLEAIRKFQANHGFINLSNFTAIMNSCMVLPRGHLISRVFAVLDVENHSMITPQKFIEGLSLMLRGTVEERIEFAFNVYDKRQTKELDSTQLLECLVEAIHNDFGNLPVGFVQDLMKLALAKLDVDRDGVINYRDFKQACTRDISLLESLGPVFPRNGNFETMCGKRAYNREQMAGKSEQEAQLSLDEKFNSYLNYSPLFNELWKMKIEKSEPWRPLD